MIHPFLRLLQLTFMLLLLPSFGAGAEDGRVRYEEQDISQRLLSLAGREPAVLQFDVVATDSARFLLMESEEPFAVFREGMVLVSGVRWVRWSADSIGGIYGMPLTLSVVRQKRSPLALKLQVPVREDPMDPGKRTQGRFMEFAVIIGALVIVYLSLLMFSAVRNLREYLIFSRAFITGSREDRPSDAGLTATSGILVYGFFILAVSYTLTLYLSPAGAGATFSELMVSWLGRLLSITIFLMGKLVMVSFFSFLYRIPEAAPLQVTGMIRSGLFICLLLLVILIPVMMTSPKDDGRLLILTWVWIIVQTIHTITLYMRLQNVTGARPFHLFSYLCISELIPLVYLVTTL